MKTAKIKYPSTNFVLWISLILLVAPTMAMTPVWTYSYPSAKIGSVAISSDGNSIVVGSGLLYILSHDGQLQATQPYGDNVAMTPDGSTIVSSFGPTVYLFKQNFTRNPKIFSSIHEIWETQLLNPISSLSISDNGKMVALSTQGSGLLEVYSSKGGLIGYNNQSYYPVVKISSDGQVIVGLSQTAMTVVDKYGRSKVYFNLSVVSDPTVMALTSDGDAVFFNDDQRVWCASTKSNGSAIWSSLLPGDINALAVTPSGSDIFIGTDNGYVDHFDKNGNLTWEYNINQNGTRGSMVQSVAVSDNGANVIAGTYDGKTLMFSSDGDLLWSNQTNDHIHHVVLTGDGSFAIATGDYTVYAYQSVSSGASPSTASTVVSTLTPGEDNPPVSDYGSGPADNSTVVPTPVSQDLSQYSTIQTAQGSPLSPVTGYIAIIVIIVLIRRKG
ncbi:MAG: PQQ-binding-like beta-propeller repeat protein [Methanoregula sp.]|uniref:WD40 repeat domain-containing protein n=1 Tax=Methanoregula sp. TaxID=2052170 RepID=UPI003BAE79C1